MGRGLSPQQQRILIRALEIDEQQEEATFDALAEAAIGWAKADNVYQWCWLRWEGVWGGLQYASVSRAITRLEERGLLMRGVAPDDGWRDCHWRRYWLTEAGAGVAVRLRAEEREGKT